MSEHFGEIASDSQARPDHREGNTQWDDTTNIENTFTGEYKIQPYKYLGRKMVDKRTQNKKKMLYETIFMIAQINQAVS